MRNLISLLSISLLVACTGTLGEGGGDDTPPPPPPATDVQLVVQDGAAPQAGVRVIFQTAANTVIAEVVTGADGVAKTEMDAGNVTVIRTFPPEGTPPAPRAAEIYTYVGVKAGDRLVLGQRSNDLTPPNAINVRVPEDANGTVKVVTPCGSGQGTAPLVPISVRGCDAMVDFYVTDADNSSFTKKAAFGENIDLSLEPLLGALAATVAATNVPADTTVNVELRIVSGVFELYSSGQKRVDQASTQVNLPNLTGVDQLLVTSISNDGKTQMVARREVYSASPAIVDATVGLIPTVATPDYSPAGISWVQEGTGTADFVIARLDVTPGPTSLPGDYIRTIIAPHTGMLLQLPILSGADAKYNPIGTDQIAGSLGLGAMTGGYDAARARVFTVDNVVELAPAGGTATLSYTGNAPTR